MPKRLTRHELLYREALSVLDDLFADTTVDRETAKETLQGLKDTIDIMLDTLRRAT